MLLLRSKGLRLAPLLLLIAARAPIWVIDGDTIDIRGERVRIANLDAPDVGSHAKCQLEQRRGAAAKATAIRLVRSAANIRVAERTGTDRYGRTLALVELDGQDFGDLMIRAGQGRPWRGHSSNWCA
jgi:micrococcal nuclease